ncbi:hypothetical protein B9Q13_00740 [Candidatus Marsarchaeota G2 archaeon ECH_B_SAG-G16]|uniref:Uncharacterized protein n=6 Tax=Candidatus Marsarchaeota TaxID=1978152 RepID=A0A2R6C1J3_9ARCH|nr:MAG: hypothetical protein B9Q01_07475 [Candidatus Marsarchaeota G1 archaeon OSP_D]PSN84969.1 MAG: hypothetical protein B9Q02_08095 [Candidatus Marsarchaeota G1 archaeon BE_D]PSN88063.1 MAG: hypothetical protein B9Q00_06905 [Candidatus Marsarchaeota G1 archaeon OSP_C]PSO01864.1 MAG: hypothetical protein B9Q10_01960 [Candidatus Marsarchaeota G2 archaeon ECH_B_SAG-E12]PSO04758.1 MAG: hypothetical protein B9Q12_01850 [Candidatus Marsarchaeota G2 archaeon ECH_B_SAG-G06]PSO05805.1 MAG: hypothetic
MSAENPDIKGKVEGESDSIKKLELLIPGLRGYRQKEDVRVANELLRNQMADTLDRTRQNLESLRKKAQWLATMLSQIASFVSQLQALSGEVRHAQ